MKNQWIAVIFPAVFATAVAAQTPVRVGEIRQETLQERHAVTGTLRAVARGDVAALESGRLLTLTVRAGDQVKRGDLIAEVDDRRLNAERSAAEADKRVAEADLKRSRATARRAAADLTRGEKLIRQNAVSRQELDRYRAVSAVAAAEAEADQRRVERATETLRLLDVRLSDTTVVAPYDGSVVARHVEPGDWVRPGDPLLTLVSTGPLEAWLEVPERFARTLHQSDDRLVIQSKPLGKKLSVTDVKRLPEVNPQVRTLSIIAVIQNEDGLLTPGMSVQGWVPAGRRGDHLTVPKDAIVRREGQPKVFVVGPENVATERSVRVLFEIPDRVAIDAASLTPGTRVVVEGNERLTHQQVVKVVRDTAVSKLAKKF